MYACKSLVSCLVRFLLFVDGVTVRARRFSVVDACGWARIWVWARATALLRVALSLFCLAFRRFRSDWAAVTAHSHWSRVCVLSSLLFTLWHYTIIRYLRCRCALAQFRG